MEIIKAVGAGIGMASNWIQVDTLLQAQALVGLAAGNYVQIVDLGITVNIYDVSGGTTWAAASKKYYTYAAGARLVKNVGIGLITSIPANNTLYYLRMRTTIHGPLQWINIVGDVDSDTLVFKIDDPLQFSRASGQPRYTYHTDGALSLRSTGRGVYNIRWYFNIGGADINFVDSVQHTIGNDVVSIPAPKAAINLAYSNYAGLKIERLSGAGNIICERANLICDLNAQDGFYA